MMVVEKKVISKLLKWSALRVFSSVKSAFDAEEIGDLRL